MDSYPEQAYCDVHGIKLLVLKTDTRGVRSTRYPPFRARRVFLYCPLCKSEAEKTSGLDWKYMPRITPLARGKSPFSMDVIAQVGRMKFLECKRRNEIREALMEKHGIYASDGTISAMGMEFLARLKCIHMLEFDRLAKDIEDGGGYILGIDGTGDGGSDRIFLGMDLIRDWVLVSARIPSESEENMKPHLNVLKERLGFSLANVCDMSPSMINVLTDVMPDVALRLCHYHVLSDIGSDLMKDNYMIARQLIIDTRLQPYLKRLRKKLYYALEKEGIDISKTARELRSGTVPSGISVETCTRVQTYDTISWMLRYHEDNAGLCFPFSLPYLNFYRRCQRGLDGIISIRKMTANGRTSPKYIRELENTLRNSLESKNECAKVLRGSNAAIKYSYELFEELRKILHIPRDKGDIPRDKLIIHNNETIAEMRTQLEEFRERLRKKTADGLHPKEKIIMVHLDKYWPNIVLDNATVNINGQDTMIEIPRTSSSYESCFGMIKSDLRKRLGKKNIGHELNMYGDHLGYIQNLKSDSYVSLMYSSLDNLPKAFEKIPPDMVKKEMELLRKRMKGYDVTNTNSRGKNVELDDIIKGVETVEKRIDVVLLEEYLRPPELYGRQSNGLLTL